MMKLEFFADGSRDCPLLLRRCHDDPSGRLRDPAARDALADFGLLGFAPVSPGDHLEHPALRRAGRRRPPRPLVALERRAASPPI